MRHRFLLAGAAAAAVFSPVTPVHAQSGDAFGAATAGGGEIVVTAGRRAQTTDQVGGAISVFTEEMIENQQLLTVDDVLQRMPGVAIVRSGGVGQNTQVRMRGFTTKHVLVMVDGIKLNNPSEADNQYGLEHLFLDGVQRVEVLRGPQSGLYGGDASAGVINVITRRPAGEPQFRLSGLYGTHDTFQITGASSGRLDSVGYSVGASYFQTDGISLASRPPGNVEADGYDNLTLNARFDWEASDNLRFDTWLRYIDSENDTDNGFLPADNPLGLPPFLFQDSEGSTETQQFLGAARVEFDMLDGRLTYTAQVTHVDISGVSLMPGTRQESHGRTTEVTYYATFNLGRDSYLLAGIEHKNEAGRFDQPSGGGFATVDDSISETGLFANANLQLVDGLFLSGSIRNDDNSLFGDNTTWRVAGAYNLPRALIGDTELKLRASYGTGAEAPGLRQLLGSSPTYQGNPDLTPESSWMWDAGVDLGLAGGLVRFGATYYHGKATDGIFNITNPETGISSPQNVDSPVRMKGWELEAGARPADWIELHASYTRNSTRLEGADTQLFGRPRHEGSAAVTLRPVPAMSLTADIYLRGKFFSDYPTTYEMPAYEVFNISAGWDFTQQLRLSLRVQNLFDKFYEEKLGDSTYGRTATVRIAASF